LSIYGNFTEFVNKNCYFTVERQKTWGGGIDDVSLSVGKDMVVTHRLRQAIVLKKGE
jgi:hypothetical protein